MGMYGGGMPKRPMPGSDLMPPAPPMMPAPMPGGMGMPMQGGMGGQMPPGLPMPGPLPMMTPQAQQQQDAIRSMMDQQLNMYRPQFQNDMIGPGHEYGDMPPPMELGDEYSVLAPDSMVQPPSINMTPEQRIRKMIQDREGRVR